MTKGLIKISSICFVLLAFLSCNKEEPIPSYVHIDGFNLVVADPQNQGSSANRIVDAWIYVDDQLAGAFELPCTIPLLYAGTHHLKIFPGVKENGIAETRIPYPFYTAYEADVELVPGSITQVNPSTSYITSATFPWIEDFDGIAHGFCKSDGATPDTNMVIFPAPDPIRVFEGSGSGGFELINQSSYFGLTCNKYSLPKGGASVFLEVNYNCNTDLNIGLVGYDGTGGIALQKIVLTMRPSTGWNKVYVNLTNDLITASTSSNFAIFFSMAKKQDIAMSYAYLDNIKLIH